MFLNFSIVLSLHTQYDTKQCFCWRASKTNQAERNVAGLMKARSELIFYDYLKRRSISSFTTFIHDFHWHEYVKFIETENQIA